MTPERWQQIDQILQAALELAPEHRCAFLDKMCAGDEALRSEVEGFVAAHEEAGSFIESSAMTSSARALADNRPETMAGKLIGHYRILQPLGAGGMGEVYVAMDTRMDRKVALKLLPALFTQDEQRIRRFRQEARTVLGLNHPNIVTIYEIGHAGQTHFIASELVEGETVRQLIERGQLDIVIALDIAAQVAGALRPRTMWGSCTAISSRTTSWSGAGMQSLRCLTSAWQRRPTSPSLARSIQKPEPDCSPSPVL